MQNLIKANKNGKYQIKPGEEGFYHVRLVSEVPTKEGKVIIDEKVQIFSIQGFKQFLANKKALGYTTEEIVHDPTLEVEEEDDPTPGGEKTGADPADAEPVIKMDVNPPKVKGFQKKRQPLNP